MRCQSPSGIGYTFIRGFARYTTSMHAFVHFTVRLKIDTHTKDAVEVSALTSHLMREEKRVVGTIT